jgi:hypothetical protein
MAMLELIEDIAKLGLIVAALYSALSIYVRRRWPAWAEPLGRHRLGVLLMLIFAMIAIKVSEDVLGQESGPMDEAILWFLRAHVPSALTGFLKSSR